MKKGANQPIYPVLTSNSGLTFLDTAQLWHSAQHAASYTPKSYQQKRSRTSYQFLSGTRLHVVGIWICVLQGVTTLSESRRKRERKGQESQSWKSAQSHLCDHSRLRSYLLTSGQFLVEFPTLSLEELVQVCVLWRMTSQRFTSRWFFCLVHVLDQKYCLTKPQLLNFLPYLVLRI